MLRQNADDISAQTHVQGMAKADHAAVTQNQVQAAGGQRKDQHPAHKGQRKRLARHAGVNRHCQQQRHKDGHKPCRKGVALHWFLTGKRPAGFRASTAAMKMQVSMDASAGPAACAVLRSRNSRSIMGKKALPAVSIRPTISAE